MPTCKLCKQNCEKLVDSHIIPRAFFENMKLAKEKNKALILLTNDPNKHQKKSRIGIYDQFLCKNCEVSFNNYDNYATSLFLNEKNFFPIKRRGEIIAWEISYDYFLLKMFFISLLWRAGASNHFFFKQIQLGKHLDRLQEYLLKKEPGDEQNYLVFLGRYDDNYGKGIILDPHRENRKTFNNKVFYRFYLGYGYLAYIKVDSMPLYSNFLDLALHPRKNKTYILNRGNIREKSEIKIVHEAFDQLKKDN